MNRRTALKTLFFGTIGMALVHPKSRRTISHNYKQGLITIFKPQIGKSATTHLQNIFNFNSKKEEEQLILDLKNILQNERLAQNKIITPKVTLKQIKPLIDNLTKKRQEYAQSMLAQLGEVDRTAREKELKRFFKDNQRRFRVPSELEIREIIQNKTQYNFE
ncbi:MAG: hypothetical protein WC915_06270 [archaeon]|jgi:hypothetical protein